MQTQKHASKLKEAMAILATMQSKEKDEAVIVALKLAISALSSELYRFLAQVDEAEQMLRIVVLGNNIPGMESKFAWEYLRKQLNLSQEVLDEVETRLFPESV